MSENANSMPKEERKRTILRFLYDRQVMLPPKPLHDNLEAYEGVTFSYRTTKRLCKELVEEGLLRYVDKGKGYYQITDLGREYLVVEDEDSDIEYQ
ncbi:ArsR family transcriptional regulator [Halorubrum sp. SS5]|nr:ArsR family transcriptional regulator [Halorubrum sp. SS5]